LLKAIVPSVRRALDPRLNGQDIETHFTPYDWAMFPVSWRQIA